MKLGLFYGTTTGMTEAVAEKIKKILGAGIQIYRNIGMTTPEEMASCDRLIFGIPTWNDGELQSDWDAFIDKLNSIDFAGKLVAIYGLGDQAGYPDTYQDAIGILGRKVYERGGKLVGFWSTEGYEFAKSKAVMDGKFMGLALDETSHYEKTDDRIKQWVTLIRVEFEAAVAAE